MKLATYEEAKKILKKAGVKTSWEFKKLRYAHNLPKGIPSQPERTYKKDWKGYGEFMGTNRKGDWQDRKNYKSYKAAKKWARESSINSLKEYRYAKLPSDMPRNPWAFYKDEWEGGKEWINPKSRYISLIDARELVRKLEIYTPLEYAHLDKKKHKIPNSPNKSYKEWAGWTEFLPKKFVTFEEAKKFVRENNIPNYKVFKEIAQKGYLSDHLPRSPSAHYKEWKGSDDFFNWEKPFLPYKEAQKLVKALGIQRPCDYERLSNTGKLPEGLPKSPYSVYSKINSRWIK